MDKLRAIEYFVSAVREGSLSAAARQLGVSVPAVSKLLTALEQGLGARLFERGPQGLRLTPAGQEYLDACAPALQRIAEADAAVGLARTQAVGTVAIAMQQVLALHCVAPALPRLHARHPQLQLDLRDYALRGSPETESADLRLALVWEESADQVTRVLARPAMVVCAAPRYWARHGIPQRPKDLAGHRCCLLRSVRGTVMDHWPFERAGEKEDVVVGGWITTSNNQRDVAVAAALVGEGIVRSLDLVLEDHLRAGRLVPVLADWSATDAPSVRLMYRPSAGRLTRVRVVIDFLAELFGELEHRCATLVGPHEAGTAPPWVGPRAYARSSIAAQRGGPGARGETP